MAVAVALAWPACGLGDREAMADAVIDSVDAARRAGTATGTISVSMRVSELPGEIVDPGIAGLVGAPTPETTFGVELDLRRDRARLSFERPFEVFDDLTLYGTRHAASARDARPWVKVAIDTLDAGATTLDPEQDPPLLAVAAVNPAILLDLVAGALTGSVERGAPAEVAGRRAVPYRANFDVEKALRDTRRDAYDEDRREAVEDLLEGLAVDGTVHEGEAWIDEDGLPRRFVLTLPVSPRRGFEIEVTITLDLHEYGRALDIAVPGDEELLEVDSLIGFLRAVVPGLAGSAA